MQQLKSYLTKEGWKRDWEEAKGNMNFGYPRLMLVNRQRYRVEMALLRYFDVIFDACVERGLKQEDEPRFLAVIDSIGKLRSKLLYIEQPWLDGIRGAEHKINSLAEAYGLSCRINH